MTKKEALPAAQPRRTLHISIPYSDYVLAKIAAARERRTLSDWGRLAITDAAQQPKRKAA